MCGERAAAEVIDFRNQRILIIAPHPDDEVLGCGGLIARAKREGAKVFVLYLTVGTIRDFSKRGRSTAAERTRELERVARFLRFDGWRIAFVGNDYHMRLDTLAQKDIIHEIERGEKISLEVLRPTLLLMCHPHDYNQDHRQAASAAIAATRPGNVYKHLQRHVLAYENPTNSWMVAETQPLLNFFVELKREDFAAKVKALSLYRSQMKHPQSIVSPAAVTALARLRGMQSGVALAEAFEAKRFLI